jgi:hypothetical protein
MDPSEFVDIRTRRYMAQALEEFERDIERPLRAAVSREPGRPDIAAILSSVEGVKRTFRKKLQALGSDCKDLMDEGIQINGFEPVIRR